VTMGKLYSAIVLVAGRLLDCVAGKIVAVDLILICIRAPALEIIQCFRGNDTGKRKLQKSSNNVAFGVELGMPFNRGCRVHVRTGGRPCVFGEVLPK